MSHSRFPCLRFLVLPLILVIGCRPEPPPPATFYAVNVESAIDLLYDTSGELVEEDWYVHRIDDNKIGHRWVRVFRVNSGIDRGTRRLVKDQFAIPRFNGITYQTLRTVTLENEHGVKKLAYEVDPGRRQRVAAQVDGDRLRIKRIDGKATVIDWSKSIQGYNGIEVSLTRSPLKPGETRTVSVVQEVNDKIVTYDLKAGDWQPSPLQFESVTSEPRPTSETEQLLPIVAMPRGGGDLSETLTYWLSRDNRLVRRESSFLNQTMDRCTKVQAMAANDSVDFDVALKASIPLDEAIESPEQVRSARYRVTGQNIDPARLFASGTYQTVTPIDEQNVEIEVALPHDRSSSGPQGQIADSSRTRPSRADLQSNRWLESNSKTIVSFADAAVGNELDPKAAALAIRQRVYDWIDKTESDRVLASAATAATERKGDCTEHAMLVAAACRARKIPARVVVGLIYDEPSQSMVYHMWTEIWDNRQWLPIDATRPRPDFIATRLKMSDENLNEVSDFGIVAPVVRAAGKLEIEVLEASDGR